MCIRDRIYGLWPAGNVIAVLFSAIVFILSVSGLGIIISNYSETMQQASLDVYKRQDPVSRKEFWDMLARLKEQGIIILVSTAYMDEASRCDRIALIREGELIASNTPQGIIEDVYKRQALIWSQTLMHIYRCFRF